MKRVIVMSVHDAFDYVMDHYAPAGLEELASRRDNYAIISLQDSVNGGLGLRFCENEYCKGVLTLTVDDIEREVEGAVLFSDEQAERIVSFVGALEAAGAVDTLVVHCYAGQSRSCAVGTALLQMLDLPAKPNRVIGNQHIYDTLMRAIDRRSIRC